ncbi:hypothetical protein [Bradyrhizobium retamae]|uniref:hypothetical protein n=1 Tax=Bradyrhizobium retamae TaxID=1300035 RepID=UPI0012E3917B|nr:hypothetical protein [Bradyrhizobium retamae]
MNGFRAGKRVFLTGHMGFKGSWLAFSISASGKALTPRRPYAFSLIAFVGAGMESINDQPRSFGQRASQRCARYRYPHSHTTIATLILWPPMYDLSDQRHWNGELVGGRAAPCPTSNITQDLLKRAAWTPSSPTP